jgi:hypothetical protein
MQREGRDECNAKLEFMDAKLFAEVIRFMVGNASANERMRGDAFHVHCWQGAGDSKHESSTRLLETLKFFVRGI